MNWWLTLDRVCPRCGKAIHDDAMVFCPYCSASLTPMRAFSTTAGILIIIAACITIIIGALGIVVLALNFYHEGAFNEWSFPEWFFPGWFFTDLFSILGFAFGLTAGICSLKRKRFALSVAGTSLVLVSGFVTIILLATYGQIAWLVGFAFGMPTILLSILGIVFLGVSQDEFA